MKGLYKKDLLQIGASWYVQLVIAAIVIGVLLYYKAAIGTVCFLCVFCAMQATSTIFIDRASGWTAYAVTFPLRRSAIVRSKFNLAIAGCLFGLLLGLLIVWISGNPVSLEDWRINGSITAILVCSIVALQIPLSYLLKKSAEFLAIIAAMLPAGFMILLWSQSITSEVSQVNGQVVKASVNLNLDLLLYMAIGCGIALLISYFVTPVFLSRRDV